MKPYSKADIEEIYAGIIQYAYKCKHRGLLQRAIKGIEAASEWAYNLNLFYRDDIAEKLIKDIAESKIDKKQIDKSIQNRCVLIDSFLLDNRGLSQQYLRAMIANGMHILVIFTRTGGIIGKDILREIKLYDKAKIISYPKGMGCFEETQEIVNEIYSFAPSHIFLHITPWDVIALMACHCIKGPIKYNINLTDHAFWLGVSFLDYNLEFRPYGYTVSLEKRGLLANQILSMPFYPIKPLSHEFEGFPQIPKNSLIVFTGGALYKMLGKKDIFFHIMERILAVSPDVVILVAGFNNSHVFDVKISNIKGNDRVFNIGIRKDIDAVFENCDIFLETYPTTGGLMAQYAAMHAKPIVTYRDVDDVENAIEEMIYLKQNFKSYTDLDEMTAYVEKLVNDENFRRGEGKLLKEGMMTQDIFNDRFVRLINFHEQIKEWDKDKIDYDAFFNRYLELENIQFEGTKAVIKILKWETFAAVKNKRWNLIEQFVKLVCNRIEHCLN